VWQARLVGNRNSMRWVRSRLPESREDRLAVYWLVGTAAGRYRYLVHKPVLFQPWFQREGRRMASKWYPDAKHSERHWWVLHMLRAWESVTRIQGPVFVLFALLLFAAPFATQGRARSASLLFALVALTLMVTPVATVEFSARTAVPGFGALGAAAAMGG
jgi:hypothetical protein